MADGEKLQIQEISKQLTKISRSLSFHSIGPKCCKVELPSRGLLPEYDAAAPIGLVSRLFPAFGI